MTRAQMVSLLALIVAVPVATAGAFLSASPSVTARPCFVSGNTGYEVTASASAQATVRIDNSAPNPSLRLQLVDDPAAADFVLVDDGDAMKACKAITIITRVRVDPAATAPDLTVALSREPADHKIFVQSANFTQQDAAALFAVIWHGTRKSAAHAADGSGLTYATRQ
ncbi:MAG: hypothetical protein Q8M26_15615 [Pseudolabrys sp.]|nr:hypothetical protein [Pseudolabrys sp.]